MNYKAVYKKLEFDANYCSHDSVILRSSDKSCLEMGFKEIKKSIFKKIYVKEVNENELDEIYEIAEYVTWKNKEFLVFGETDTTYTLYYSYTNMDKEKDMIGFCRNNNFDVYDRNVFVKSVPKKEISNYRFVKLH